jgi:protein gp37
MGNPNYKNGFTLTLHEQTMELPLKWKKPQNIFVNSMSDLFHENVPAEFIFRIFNVMCSADWHKYQILTKRPKRLLQLNPKLSWKPHIWVGVTVEEKSALHRIDYLRSTNAQIKFISFEPLIGPIHDIDLRGIDWVIVGGESGPNARPIEPAWVMDIRDQCEANGVPFFFKQWGGTNKKKNGRLLEGKLYNEMPIPCL